MRRVWYVNKCSYIGPAYDVLAGSNNPTISPSLAGTIPRGCVVSTGRGRRVEIMEDWNRLFEYYEGFIMWKPRPREGFETAGMWRRWNNTFPGKVIGEKNAFGYYMISHNNRRFFVHRIIWEMHNGPMPDGLVIDHIDRRQDNNHIDNLRLATLEQNAHNHKKRNGSKPTGAYQSAKGVWYCKMNYTDSEGRKCRLHLGPFPNKEEAGEAYKEAAIKHRGEFVGDL